MTSVIIREGDARALPFDSGSVHCVVTSPPYWGLRDYGAEGQMGAELLHDCGAWARGADPCGACFVCNVRLAGAEVWRVLRSDGTFWLNLGDSYYNYRPSPVEDRRQSKNVRAATFAMPTVPAKSKRGVQILSLKSKDLAGIPWRCALALQADGWYLRSDIIWSKPNPLPESVTDRPTKSHEYIFLFSKSESYYYDAYAVREESTERASGNITRKENQQNGRSGFGISVPYEPDGTGRNRRTVWTVTTKPYKGAHFATYPPELFRPCIMAGTSEAGVCPECGANWERIVERRPGANESAGRPKKTRGMGSSTSTLSMSGNGSEAWRERGGKSRHTGWRPTCAHYDERYRVEYPRARSARKAHQRDATGDWWKRVRMRAGLISWGVVPAVVCDPFTGSGTTALEAQILGRDFIGTEINPEFIALAEDRVGKSKLQEWTSGQARVIPEPNLDDLPLFNVR